MSDSFTYIHSPFGPPKRVSDWAFAWRPPSQEGDKRTLTRAFDLGFQAELVPRDTDSQGRRSHIPRIGLGPPVPRSLGSSDSHWRFWQQGWGNGGREQLPGHHRLVAASDVEVLVLLLEGGDLLLQHQVLLFL